ncbi:GNAT family N-acetyltransferase [Novosphingobium sp. 9U]|uniref:GNAT family N-acetyltransferase n=1 Tax=Novosphingobium sp. 9U TaxID=2653158 RepID=UPI0012F3B9D7|nr:GNAT family N-acetyltransferase [Novosphingobium sp. 9U]VWX50859.1 GNAT family N-acetyltransferase [Novosphingobium sp. 9U]
MARQLKLTRFRDVPLDDPFFDSLKEGYDEFPQWFARKADEPLYVIADGRKISGMIYLKREDGPVTDVVPPLPARVWLKVGTLKIEPARTKLGERAIKKILDTALSEGAEGIYVTVFEVHRGLIALFERYGFVHAGTKTTDNGVEQVYVRSLTEYDNDPLMRYPFIRAAGRRYWLLAIYPEYHTRLLPDSILNNEPREIVEDVSHTNTIHKVYISGLALQRMSPGDPVIFYRTSDRDGQARYRSVVTSVCVVEEVRQKRDFGGVDPYLAYTKPRSVFDEEELRDKYLTSDRLAVAKLTYNAAFARRVIRQTLLDEGILTPRQRPDLVELGRAAFDRLLELGEVNARLVID